MEETQRESLESIKLTKNAKGDMQYEIKVYAEELGDEAFERLKNIRNKLETEYGKSVSN